MSVPIDEVEVRGTRYRGVFPPVYPGKPWLIKAELQSTKIGTSGRPVGWSWQTWKSCPTEEEARAVWAHLTNMLPAVPTARPVPVPLSPVDYAHQIGALIVILAMLVAKLQEIKAGDPRPHHSATLGHLRSALDYQRKLLDVLRDPAGMTSMTAEVMDKIGNLQPTEAVALLTQETAR